MYTVYTRVCAWNEARYKREYDKKLTISLLREEYKEYLEATTEVDQLDALCDLVYVAMGGLWKAGVPDVTQQIHADNASRILEVLVNEGEINPVYFIGTYLDVYEHLDNYPCALTMHSIITAACTQMTGLMLTLEQCEEAMLIVCDSNDSKAVKRTASNVKANVDKGEGFIAPEPRLKELLRSRGIH